MPGRARSSAPSSLLASLGLVLVCACSLEETPFLLPQAGQFLDSPVQGLAYGQDARTDVQGTFFYPLGATLEFRIGDILLGSDVTLDVLPARGQRLVTPVDLVPTAVDENHPQVVNMARFLQTIDFDLDVSNGIQVVEELHGLAQGSSLDFTDDPFTFALAAQAILHDFRHVLGGGRSLISAERASAHLGQSLRGAISGRYRGTYVEYSAGEGDVAGLWELCVTRAGEVCGWILATGASFEEAIVGQASSDGSLVFQVPASGGFFSGRIDDFELTGDWTASSSGPGSFAGECQDDVAAFLGTAVSSFAGDYAGTMDAGGETLTVTIDASGDLSLLDPLTCGTILAIDSSGVARFSGVSSEGDRLEGTISPSGVLQAEIINGEGSATLSLVRQ